MDEEKKLKELLGTGQPFTLPKDYFNDFHERMMKKIPAPRPKKRLYMRWAVAAAMIGAVCTTSLILTERYKTTPTTEASYSFSEEELEYTLITNQDITEYLMGSE